MTAPRNLLTTIGTITSQAVFITAMFYYFGWVYAHSFFGYFGVDSSLVDYSTTDYLLRSINATFDPFMYLIFVAFVLFNAHRLMVVPMLMRVTCVPYQISKTVNSGVSGRSSTPKSIRSRISQTVASVGGWARALRPCQLGLSGVRWIIGALQAVTIIFAVTVFAGVLLPEQVGTPLGIFLPLLFMLTVILLGYIEHLRLRYVESLAAMTTPSSTPPSLAYASTLAYILALLTAGMVAGLWTVSNYAEHVGNRVATELADQLPARPGIVIYSTQRIALNGPGVEVGEITAPDIKYHYKYTGLRLLIRSADKFLLLPSKWQHGRDHVFFLQDGNDVRIDVIAR